MKRTFLVSLFECISLGAQFFYFIFWAYYFGAGSLMDAFWTAYALPVILTSVISEPLVVSLVPILVQTGLEENKKSYNELKKIFFTWTLVAGGIISILLSINSPIIIKVIAPGLPPATSRLSITILKILSLSLVFRLLNAVLTSFYYSREKYYWPTLIPGLGIIASIIFLIIFEDKMGILALAWGMMTGLMIQFLLMIPILNRTFFCFSFKWRIPKKLLNNISVLVSGNIYYKSDILVDRYMASFLPTKSISYIGFGHKLANIINRIIVSGLLTTRFTELTKNHICDTEKFKKLVHTLFIKILFLGIPLIVCLFSYIRPVVIFLFSRGAYTLTDSNAISSVILAYSGMIFFGLLGSLMASAFYVIQDTRSITLIGIVSFTAGIGLKIIGMRIYSYLGVAMATSIYFGLALVLEMVILHKKKGILNFPTILINLGKFIVAGGFAGLTAFVLKSIVGTGPISIFMGIILILVVFIAVTYAFKSEESQALINNLLDLIRNFKEKIIK